MGGSVKISLEREPSFFGASKIEGPLHYTFVGRIQGEKRLGAMGSISIRRCYVNGHPAMLPYASGLRFDRNFRGNPRFMVKGYRHSRPLIEENGIPFWITSIASENRTARRVLTTGIPGMPEYRELETIVTFLMPTPQTTKGTSKEPVKATTKDLNNIASCLDRFGKRHQFTPVWTKEDLLSTERTPNLKPSDFFIDKNKSEVRACLALWDQTPFKQTIVRGYNRRISRLLPLINAVGKLTRRPALPSVNEPLKYAFLSHLALDDSDSETFLALVHKGLSEAAHRGLKFAALGLSSRSPFLPLLKQNFKGRAYETTLYQVVWKDTEQQLTELDPRIAHVEIAVL